MLDARLPHLECALLHQDIATVEDKQREEAGAHALYIRHADPGQRHRAPRAALPCNEQCCALGTRELHICAQAVEKGHKSVLASIAIQNLALEAPEPHPDTSPQALAIVSGTDP